MRAMSSISAAVVLALAVGQVQAQSSGVLKEAIPAQPLATALDTFSRQTGWQVVYMSRVADGLQSSEVAAGLRLDEALHRLLDGTGLAYEFLNERTVTITTAHETPAMQSPSPSATSHDAVEEAGARATLEEIVVSATKRDENMREVPISISALGEGQLVQGGIKNIADLNSVVPGLHLLSANVGGGINYQMRGVASQVGAGTVAIYIDDTPIQNRNSKFSSSANPSLFDLERVEVLRGPQGTLFGASSEGGTIRFITPQPSLTDWSGHARSEFGFVAHGSTSQELGVAFGGPLSEGKVGFRASVLSRKDPGWIDQVSRATGAVIDHDINEGETNSARVALKIQATDNLSITPSVYYSRVEFDDWSAYYGYLGSFRNAQTIHQPSKDEFWLPTLTVNYDHDAFNLTSITSYFDRTYERIDDFSGIVADFYSIPGRNPAFLIPTGPEFWTLEAPGLELVEQSNWTQEIRATSSDPGARLLWTVGAYYSRSELGTGQYVTASKTVNPTNTGPFALLPGNYAGVSEMQLIDEQIAAFGEVTYRVTDALKLTAGVRVGKVTIDTVGESYGFFQGGYSTVGPESVSETPVTPKFSAAYQLSDAGMLYATIAKGYRPGGLNNSIPATNCAADFAISGEPSTSYDSDSVWSYELGTKMRLLDNRIDVTASVFYIDWQDIQQSVSLPGCGSNYTTNLGSAVSQGAELEMQALVGERWTFGMNAAYTDATLAENVLGNANPNTGARALLGKEGDRVILTPEWTAAASVRYDLPLSPTVNSYVRAEYKFFDDYTRTPGPATSLYNPKLYAGDAYSLVSLRMGVEWDRLDLALFANNLLDDDTVTYKASASFLSRYIVLESTPQPRTIGLSATYKW